MDGDSNKSTEEQEVSVCMEIAAAESMPELNVEAPKVKDMD